MKHLIISQLGAAFVLGVVAPSYASDAKPQGSHLAARPDCEVHLRGPDGKFFPAHDPTFTPLTRLPRNSLSFVRQLNEPTHGVFRKQLVFTQVGLDGTFTGSLEWLKHQRAPTGHVSEEVDRRFEASGKITPGSGPGIYHIEFKVRYEGVADGLTAGEFSGTMWQDEQGTVRAEGAVEEHIAPTATLAGIIHDFCFKAKGSAPQPKQ